MKDNSTVDSTIVVEKIQKSIKVGNGGRQFFRANEIPGREDRRAQYCTGRPRGNRQRYFCKSKSLLSFW